MREFGALILGLVATLFLVAGYVVQDIVHSLPADEVRDANADYFFFLTDAAWKLAIPVIVLYACRAGKWRLVGALFSFMTWIFTGNLWDEFANENAAPAINSIEYLCAVVAVFACVCEYHQFYPIKSLWNNREKIASVIIGYTLMALFAIGKAAKWVFKKIINYIHKFLSFRWGKSHKRQQK